LPYRQSDGVINGVIIFVEMLTNEVDAERNLRFVLDSAEIGVWERDLIHNRLHVSAQAEKLLGYAPGTLGDDPKGFDSRVHPDDLSIIASAVQNMIVTMQPVKIKFRVIWPDGSVHWLYGLCECEFSEDGIPARLRGASLDITESRQHEIDLESLTADLERKVEERTQELQWTTNAKSRFLANMSHELRNPLNSVTILSKLLENEGLEGEKRKEYVRRITAAVSTVTRILDEVLDFSKLEAGQTVLDLASFSLTEMLADVSALLDPRAEAKSISIDFTPIKCNCRLWGDENRIKQILINLIGNSIKFTESGGVVVKTCHQMNENNQLEILFEITDTGIGIAPDVLPRLFQPFTQADTSITRKFGGTGLGLSIANNLAELMGGKIEVKSTPGLGSCFQLSLVLPIVENCDERDQGVLDNRHVLQGLHILVVDDDKSNTEIMREFLESYEAKITIARNGQLALKRISDSADRIDLVLMDIQMPVMDGIEASRKIRNELQQTLPIIAVTAGVLPHQQQKALSVGISELIRKPVDHVALISLILRHTDRATR
jgi:signal transduction histidine kinase/ActR/RegA family two-component response regulator